MQLGKGNCVQIHRQMVLLDCEDFQPFIFPTGAERPAFLYETYSFYTITEVFSAERPSFLYETYSFYTMTEVFSAALPAFLYETYSFLYHHGGF